MSIYNNEHSLQLVESRIKNSGYSPERIKTFFDFENYLFSKSLSVSRVLRYMTNIAVLFREFVFFNPRDTSDDQIIEIIAWIERHYKNENTKNAYKYTLRKCLEWQKKDYKTLVPINSNICHSKKLPEELYTEAEVIKMIEATTNSRNKAFLASAYEAGDRIGEHGNPQLKHLITDEYGMLLTINGKTGMRRIRLIWSVPYLVQWLAVHPQKDNPDAYLWVSIDKPHNQLTWGAFTQILKRAAKAAGIKKRNHLHLLRHSRCTHLASHLTESQMKIYFGWAGNSNMPKIYVHLSEKDVGDAILNLYGIKPADDRTVPLIKITQCPRCKQTVPDFSGFCNYCGFAFSLFDTKRMYEMEQKAKKLAQELVKEHPELASLFFNESD